MRAIALSRPRDAVLLNGLGKPIKVYTFLTVDLANSKLSSLLL